MCKNSTRNDATAKDVYMTLYGCSSSALKWINNYGFYYAKSDQPGLGDKTVDIEGILLIVNNRKKFSSFT